MTEKTTITVTELHKLVWQRPVSKVAAEMGLASQVLSNCCKAYKVPTPSSAYWSRKAFGKSVEVTPLQHDDEYNQQIVDLPTVPVWNEERRQIILERKLIASELPAPVIDEDFTKAHPIVKNWIQDVMIESVADLVSPTQLMSKDDSFRLSVTSAFLKSVVAAGGTIANADIRGYFVIKVGQAVLKIKIRQKMSDGQRKGIDLANWTIWPEHHPSRLFPTRDLKLAVTGYYGTTAEYVYSQSELVNGGLFKFVVRVLAAKLTKERRDIEKYAEELRKREQKIAQEKQNDTEEAERKKWERFEAQALLWERVQRNLSFIEELRKQFGSSSKSEFDEIALSYWLEQAKAKILTETRNLNRNVS